MEAEGGREGDADGAERKKGGRQGGEVATLDGSFVNP